MRTGAYDLSSLTIIGNGSAALTAELKEQLHEPGHDELGWLAQSGWVPLGYLNDPDKTARTFPVVDGVRYGVPGDRARHLESGEIEVLGRDSVSINTGGEKVFAEEVEKAVSTHPAVRDVTVCGRPHERWGNEIVAVIELVEGEEVSDDDLATHFARHIASYKVPKAWVAVDKIQRSPSGKADYRWAREVAAR